MTQTCPEFSCDSNITQPLKPGTITKCTCASGGTTTQWRFTTLDLCPDKFNVISLTQLAPCSTLSSSGTCGAFYSAANNSPSQAGSACPSSTLNITANQSLNGLTIECRDNQLWITRDFDWYWKYKHSRLVTLTLQGI